jgi:radical SAM superfamily enzyme YgiQ (UPF0313 family)
VTKVSKVKTDVLFIHPGGQKEIYQSLAAEFTAIATPVWASILSRALLEKGYTVEIYDTNVKGWDGGLAKYVIEKYAPRVVVIMVYGHQPSASTQAMPSAGKIAKDIKNYNADIPIAMGGLHPSALPHRTLVEEKIDFVIQGEGLETIEGIVKYLSGNCDIKNIRGLWYRRDGEIVSNEPAEPVTDLDEKYPGYAWDLLENLNSYRAHNFHCFQEFSKSRAADFSDVRSPYVTMYTSLGCPYSCSYCCINAIFGKPGIRYWSVEKVISWIDELVGKYKVKNIRFDDELFILSPKRIEKFCDMLIERNYDLNIQVYGRVDTIKDNLLKKMYKAGIRWICLGIESAEEVVRRGVNKIIRDDIYSVVKKIQDNGMYVLGNFMFGLPDDNIDTMNKTLQLAIELNCEFANFYSVMAYPGSKLYEYAIQQRWRLPDTWLGFSQHSYDTMPLPTKYLTAEEVLKFRDEAFIKYFTNPFYLESIEKKFGGVVRMHVEKMTKIKLRRKILGD